CAPLQPGRCSLPALVGAEPSVGFAAGKCRFDPNFRFFDHALVAQDVTAVAESLEPVGGLFPSVLALTCRAQPCVALLYKEATDLGQMPVKAVRLQFELFADPALRLNRTDGQLYKRARRQRGAVANIEVIPRTGARPLNRANLCAGRRACADKHKNECQTDKSVF
ncbi:MAG: hypothetical protein JRE24_10105, partial [Deltaproteobacteria bacterium]|nr:hypothetical protein [Deltaproteobacteria bacterium]